MGFLWYIIIGIAAGFLAGKIMRGGGFGVIINLILGIAGGVLGGWVFGLLGIAASGIIGSLITATVGAILMLWIASLFNKSTQLARSALPCFFSYLREHILFQHNQYLDRAMCTQYKSLFYISCFRGA